MVEDIPNYRVYINNGNGGVHDIHSLDELEFIASEELRVHVDGVQVKAVTLHVLRIKKD